MATEKIEIEILAKGKPAEKAIKGVEKQTHKLGTTTKQTGKDMDRSIDGMKQSWAGLGAKIAAVSLALGASVVKAKSFERASIGLSKAQKEWAMNASLATEATAEQVAGFLKSAKTAGLNEQAQRDLAKSAIALGYAFPHEDAETLHDNLVMLNSTGEAQGFVVDILEQKLAGLGIAFKEIDLKALPVEEKLKLINEVVRDSQKAMDESKYTDLNTALGTMSNTMTDLGDKLVKMGSDSGAFATLTATVQVFAGVVQLAAKNLGDLYDWGVKLIGLNERQTKEQERTNKAIENNNKARTTGIEKIKEMEQRQSDNNKQLEEAKRLGSDPAIIKMLEKEQRSLDKTIRKHKERLNLALGGSKNRKFGEVTASGSHIMTDAVVAGSAEADRLAKMMAKTDKAVDKTKGTFNELNQVGKSVAANLDFAFAKFAQNGKLNIKDMARSIIQDLIRIETRKRIVGFLGQFDMFSSLNTPAPKASHTGGAIGMAAIPSFHSGYRSDERLAKLQVGESVVNRAGTARNAQAIDAMNAGQKIGGGDNIQNANITFQVQAFDSASFQQGMVQNRATIVGVVREAFNRNGRSVPL